MNLYREIMQKKTFAIKSASELNLQQFKVVTIKGNRQIEELFGGQKVTRTIKRSRFLCFSHFLLIKKRNDIGKIRMKFYSKLK